MAELDIGKHCVVEDCKQKVSNTEEETRTPVLSHRHQDDHECEKLEVPKPRMAATQQLVKEIVESKKSAPARGRRGAKNSETAAKVALMKLKLHAVGDKSLPQTERTYFQVFLPKGGTDKSKPIFFCSKWSVGKVVDYAASLASLKNNNNVLTAKKLRLCHPLSGEALQMDSTLESWVSNTVCPLYNGGNVILEYLDNDCKGVDDVNSYNWFCLSFHNLLKYFFECTILIFFLCFLT
ncbi:ZFAN1 protein, partial [Polyodon spathula]|nr:ZFAN1 protein [Polyodon spathula]